MVPDDLHDYFVASASVAGALIGLLFVAMTVAGEKLAQAEHGGQLYRVRASAALTAFTNALVVSLFALIPGHVIGPATVAVAAGGLLFVVASMLSLIRLRQVTWRTVRDGLFIAALILTFAAELFRGVQLIVRPGDVDAVDNIAVLVTICFLIGIARAWELVGGPSLGVRREVVAMLRGTEQNEADSTQD